MLDKGTGYIQGCSFKDNESTIGGGAIRVAGGSELEVVSSVLLDNHAGSTGGGIVALENAVVTVKNTKFENNTAVSYGGALSAQDPGTIFKVNGTDNTTAIFKNNSSKTAGAVYMVKRAQLEISGYVFEGNSATDGRAGAVSVIDNSSATITNTTFYGNKASASGGAVVVDGSKAEIVCCEFGKENAGNVAGDKAGALLVTGGATVAVTAEDGAKYNSFNYNVANGVGGVVYVEKTSALNVANYSFTGNQGSSGGAIYIVDGAKVVSIRNQFKDNTAISGSTYGNGGAVYCAGTFTDNGSSYYENNAKNGGAVIVMGTGVATMDANLVTRGNTGNVAVMKDNAATVNGGAVFVNGGGMATISGYVLEGNVSDKAGSIQIQANAQAALKDLTFIGETGKEVYVKGNVDFNNLDGVVLVDAGASTSFVVSGYTQGNVIEFIPYKDEAKVVFKKAEGMTDEEFAEACGAITVTSASGESNWTVDENGALISFAVSITVGDTMKYFSSLKEAVEYANTTGGTGNADAMEIVLSGNASVYETLNVTKNITILGEAGTSITITRGTDFAGDMFVVAADSNAMLTLGTNNAEETGALIVDGASSSAIAGRIVDVQTGAGFTLAKNATLCNANSSIDGAAVQTASTNTVVYGVIKNNVTTTNCGGLNVLAGAKATINGATFSGNKGGTTAGALRIEAGAEVVCEDAQFTNNKGLKGNSTYVNGGAVYCAGTFTDTNSTYTGNVAKNGGVIIVVSGGVASLTGTDAQKAVLKDNQATVKGGAVFVNVGGTVTVDGYVLEGNVSEQAGSIQIQATASAELKNLTFNGENGTEIYVLGSLTFANLTGVRLVEGGSAASFVASGYEDGNVIEFTPYRYESKVVLQKADGMSDEDFATLCKAIIVTQTDDGRYWNINEEGLLVFAVASITDGDTTKYFNTLEAAVAYANNNGTTGDTAAIEVVLSEDTSISEVLNISKNITIVNASGKTVTVSRGAELTGDMFVVVADSNATLTLGTNASDESGAIVVDAASESIVAGRIVDVQTGTAFTLAKNATVQNANSSVDGAGIQTAATNTYVYGTIKDNVSTGNCGGLNVLENAKVTISGAMISGNQGGSAAGALRILAGAEVVCENTTFSNNKGLKGSSTYVNGGAVYCAGTFTDTNSSYIGNVAKNGGAIILQNGGTATLTGTDRTKAIFKDNQATGATNARGGAIFVNNGCSASVTGYIFEGNTSTGTTANTGEGAIHIISGGSASLTDVTFQGNATQNTYVAGSLTMSNLTGATLVGANANASIIVGGYQTGNALEIKPYAYTEGNVILKRADQMSEDEFVNACNAFTIIQTDDGHYWNMDETGKLCMAVAGIAVGETMSYYNTIESAIAYANTNGGTGTEASIEIKVLENTQVRETLSITKNISLVNETGKEITLNRGTELTADMFVVVADSNATLVLGCNDTNETGKLIVSGASEAAIAARTITVNTGSGFVLAKNATLSNANSTINGGAIQTASADTVIYGIVSNNVTTLEGGGMEALAGADVSIEGAVFDSNSSSTSGTGGALIIRANAQVTCSNTMFTSNHVTSAKNGGAIYCAGTFTDTNSTYTGNEAKNGGAIFIPSGGVVNLTSTDSTKAIFKNNAAIYSSGKGGAIYVNGGTLTLTGYTFDGNTCGATVSSPTEKKNVSIWTASGTATLTDCTGLTE